LFQQETFDVTIAIGLVVTLLCVLGGFAAMGGHVVVIWQPWEYVIICGAAFGTFIVANPHGNNQGYWQGMS
jgi:chemotaxis protein MotA